MKLSTKARAMLIVLFLTVGCFGMKAQEQQVTVNMENKTLKEVFSEIEKQTSYRFSYRNVVLDDEKDVTVQKRNANVTEILKAVLSGRNLDFNIVSEKSIVIFDKRQSQAVTPGNRSVSGIITDQNGEVVIGASVSLKGTSTGTVTDIDGRFELKASEEGTLVISFIGFSAVELPIKGKSLFNITLTEDNQLLDEVVVIGYGTVRRRDLTGSVSQVNSSEFERVAATDIMQAIQGRLPGLTITQTTGRPGSDSEVMVHGVQSISGGNSPMYVVDGAIVSGVGNINPQDIETFTVLKDASAVAIYGARAANGVIVVTTKRGSVGQPTITFRTEQSLQQEGNFKLKFVNAKQWIELATEAYENGGAQVPWTAADLAKVEGIDVCWPDAVKRTGFLTNNNLSVSGGSNNSNYFISLNYMDNKGIIKDQTFDRYNLRLNSDHTIRERIKFGNSINIYSSSRLTQREYDSRDTYGAAFRETPLNGMYDENGDVAPVVNNSFQGRAPSPTWILENSEIRDQYKGIEGNIYLTIDILDGLKFTTRGSARWSNSYTTNFIGAMAPHYNMEGSNVNQIRKTNSQTLHWVGDFLLDYKKTFGQDHSVNALLGYSLEEQTYEDLWGSRGDTPSNEIRYLSAGEPSTALNGNGFSEWAYLSTFGRAGYSYKDKYIFSGTLRRDGTSRLRNNKYGVFPSVSGAWRIAEEPFMQKFTWLNELKLRGSWGTVGNAQGIGAYETAVSLNQRNAVMNQQVVVGYTTTNAINNDLKWESTTKKNIGLDGSFLKNSLYFVSDFFVEDTHDLLFRQPIPRSVGLSNSPYVNAGHIRNTGIDFELGYRKRQGDWSYDVHANISHFSNEVVSLDGQASIINDNSIIAEGYPVNSIYGYRTNGLIRTQSELDNNPHFNNTTMIGDILYKDINGYDADGKLTGKPDGKIDAADREIFGKMYPDFSYGIFGSVSYKSWTLQVQLQGIQGVTKNMRSGSWITDYFGGEANMEADYILDRYHPTKNPNGKYPILHRSGGGNNGAFSDFWMIDGSYLSIRNVNINYKVPDKISGKIGFKDVNLFCGVQNLYTFGDPYADISNTVNVPIPRTWTFGLKFSL